MTSVIRYKRDPRQFVQEAYAYSNDLLMAKYHQASGDLKAAALHYRQSARLASQAGAKALAEELYRLADDCDRVSFMEID